MNTIYRIISLILLVSGSQSIEAQPFPQNDKGKPWWWIEFGQGFNQVQREDKLYLNTLQIIPSYTILTKRDIRGELKPGWLRVGIVLGTFYQGKEFGLIGGPRLTVKLWDGKTVLTASSYNVHLFGEYLLGTHSGAPDVGGRGLLGGGVGLELNNFVTISTKIHRDLIQPITYGQFGIAYLIKGKKYRTGTIIGPDH